MASIYYDTKISRTPTLRNTEHLVAYYIYDDGIGPLKLSTLHKLTW